MPRKSLPTVVFSSTPALRIKRPLPSSSEPGRKRRRPGSSHPNGTGEAETTYATANGHEGQVNGAHPITGGPEAGARGGQADEYDAEKELGAWQEFAAEHYEMVEQLPLELHRNFRLLRELDDGCVAQTEKLHILIRQYIAQRFALLKPLQASAKPGITTGVVVQDPPPIPPDVNGDEPPRSATANQETLAQETADELAVDQNVAMSPANRSPADATRANGADALDGVAAEIETAAPMPDGGKRPAGEKPHPEEMGVPVSDGQGGLVLSAEADIGTGEHSEAGSAVEPREGRRAFPHAEENLGDERPSEEELPNGGESSMLQPYLLLSDIGRLAREIVRNGEEKVAVAVGAYNSIDRHIRALDSALSAQEASILLGLRPSTLPSAAIGEAINPNAEPGVVEGGEDGEVTIGLGGGGRKGKRKGRKDKWKTGTGDEVFSGTGKTSYASREGESENAGFDLAADPNEPRYCICNQVSFGQMIACDNGDDCPIEWFHYGCVGLTTEPTGKWLCPVCRPKPGAHGGPGVGSGTGVGDVKVAPKPKGRVAPKGAQRRKR